MSSPRRNSAGLIAASQHLTSIRSIAVRACCLPVQAHQHMTPHQGQDESATWLKSPDDRFALIHERPRRR
ncbi:hypothetical protein THI_3629 [Thiomonas arsenitoxydans]|uniref:Uncharacterized protein n=1 Tax=Thiomonas arsenitoxydans (strain DSM 22701 / CIP 110005 / 3As) TaxID=426114 RepID=D6CNT3_THIA3|nr:hypothetical protein THI_3629 [Thiomonas arsenitoxydans]